MHPILDNWWFGGEGTLVGVVRGHPDFADGDRVHTSPVVERTPEANLVRTSNGTIYRLGQHSGQGYPPEQIWDERGWIAAGIKVPIPRIRGEDTCT